MTDYQKMYLTLYSAVADAIECICQTNYGIAKDLLIRSLQEAEEIYISTEE